MNNLPTKSVFKIVLECENCGHIPAVDELGDFVKGICVICEQTKYDHVYQDLIDANRVGAEDLFDFSEDPFIALEQELGVE